MDTGLRSINVLGVVCNTSRRIIRRLARAVRPIGDEVMLRIYFMQQWYALSDPAMEDSLYDVESMRRFAGVDLNGVPMRRRSASSAIFWKPMA